MKLGQAKPNRGLYAALDVGSNKVCCFIARVDPDSGIRVTGVGHQMAKGVRAGTVVDIDAVETAIGNAVQTAEQMSGETLAGVIVNVSCGNPTSRMVGVEVALAGHAIADGDVRRVLARTAPVLEPAESELVHMIPVGFAIDGCRGIHDPRGMYGERLGVDMHVVTASPGAIRNLSGCVARCHLEVDAYVVSAYAAGLACLVEDEMDLGVAVIDMGGGTTSIAVFYGGEIVFTDSVPVGGGHVTSDIARGLNTPLAQAERIKTLYGSARFSAADEHATIDVPLIGDDDHIQPNHVPKSLLVGIIQPRLEETLEMVRGRLEASGYDKIAGRRLVLTGGASQLQGMSELATLVLDKQVRLGRPLRVGGMAEATAGPAFSTCAGLLVYAAYKHPEFDGYATDPDRVPPNLLGRMGTWLRDNF